MKRLYLIFACFIFAIIGCNNAPTNQERNPLASNWDTVKFPRIDTISVGLKSDSGHYALLTYYIKRTSKDEHMIDGSGSVKLGNENWQVVTLRETKP